MDTMYLIVCAYVYILCLYMLTRAYVGGRRDTNDPRGAGRN